MTNIVNLHTAHRVRHKRRQLAAQVQQLAAECAARNLHTSGWRYTELDKAYNGQVIIGIGDNRGLWCDGDPGQCGIYEGDFSGDPESLLGLRLRELQIARAKLRAFLSPSKRRLHAES